MRSSTSTSMSPRASSLRRWLRSGSRLASRFMCCWLRCSSPIEPTNSARFSQPLKNWWIAHRPRSSAPPAVDECVQMTWGETFGRPQRIVRRHRTWLRCGRSSFIWDDPGRDRPAGPDQRPKKDGRWLAGNARGQGVRHEEGRYLDCDIDHLAGASDLTGELGWGRPTQENRLPRIAKSSSADVGGRSRVVPSAVSRGMCDSQLAALALPESGPSDARFGSP